VEVPGPAPLLLLLPLPVLAALQSVRGSFGLQGLLAGSLCWCKLLLLLHGGSGGGRTTGPLLLLLGSQALLLGRALQ
jgi:hypothetical protein